ncbi:MAG: methyltransferase domain-containing protein [Candidatus Aminicenantes bacterium]|nr:methyltransferase domain-containing protein [Candidatus Aminicenantes bacterium]
MKKAPLRNLVIFWVVLFVAVSSTEGIQQKKDFTQENEIRLNRLQPPEKIMDAIGLKPGMVIGDIGAGWGRFAVWFADRVGETGKVYANDIDMGALMRLAKRCKDHGFTNVIVRHGKVVDPNIPSGVLDIAFMINVYHHLEKPVGLVRNLAPTLKPEGVLVIVEHCPEKSGYRSESTSQEKLVKQAGQAGFELIKVDTFLERDNIYFFRPKR